MKRLPYRLCIKMRRLYADGLSCRAIAKMLGLSHQTVWREAGDSRRNYLLVINQSTRAKPAFLRYLQSWQR